jgi:ABC-type glycerol-3-phosphate transport system permease component
VTAAECATAIPLPVKPSAGKLRLDPGQGLGWSIITAATLMTSGPLLIAFLLFQRRFVQSFMRARIR